MAASDGYCPLPLTTDAAALGLVSTRVGGVAVRHRGSRSSTHATLFVHGAAGSWTTWTPFLALHEFADPVLVDVPGWGESPVDTGTSLAIIGDGIRRVMLALGYSTWDVVGHSMGGFLALHLAARWPTEVTSARLVSPTGPSVAEAVRHPWRGLASMPGFVAFRAAMLVLATADGAARAVVRGLARTHLLQPFVAPLFRHPELVDRSVVAALGAELRPRSFVAATAAIRDYDFSGWDSIRCPIFATTGDRDIFVRESDLRGASSVIGDCGHFGTVERPREVLAALGYR